jgi:hypothetical protein
VGYAVEYVVEYNPGDAAWEETMRTCDFEKARLHFRERVKHFPHSQWRLKKVQLIEFQERIPRT